MPRFKLAANAEIDVLNRDELHGELDQYFTKEWSERGRSEKYMEFVLNNYNGVTIGPNAGAVLVDGAGNGSPRSGYAWALRNVFFQTAAAAIATVWKVSDPQATNPGLWVKGFARDTSNVIHGFQFSSLQAVLKAGEYVALNLASAQAISGSIFLVYVEVPEAMLWKVE